MEVFKLKYIINDGDFSNAGNASSNIKKNMKLLGIQASIIKRVVVSVYEAEVNMVAHAHGGEINVSMDEEKICAVLKDVGPGIPDIDLAMKKGYSTASDHVRQMGFGAGMGLANIDKNTDELRIESEVGVGTIVYITSYYKTTE